MVKTRDTKAEGFAVVRRLWRKIRREFLSPPDEFDRRYGVETRRTVWRKRLSLRGDTTDYEPVNLDLFAQGIALVPRLTFVDFGCGKGRAMILAHEAGFRELVGVERSAKLANAARRNLQRLAISAIVVNADAAAYSLPERPLVAFFYNPFGMPTMERVIANLRVHRHELYVVYVNPKQSVAFSGFQVLFDDRKALAVFKA